MKAAGYSKMLISSTKLHGVMSKKTVISKQEHFAYKKQKLQVGAF
jgi:hypothetical protein